MNTTKALINLSSKCISVLCNDVLVINTLYDKLHIEYVSGWNKCYYEISIYLDHQYITTVFVDDYKHI